MFQQVLTKFISVTIIDVNTFNYWKILLSIGESFEQVTMSFHLCKETKKIFLVDFFNRESPLLSLSQSLLILSPPNNHPPTWNPLISILQSNKMFNAWLCIPFLMLSLYVKVCLVVQKYTTSYIYCLTHHNILFSFNRVV